MLELPLPGLLSGGPPPPGGTPPPGKNSDIYEEQVVKTHEEPRQVQEIMNLIHDHRSDIFLVLRTLRAAQP